MAQGVAERFWSFVGDDLDPVACWEWRGGCSTDADGKRYGAFWRDGHTVGAHVVSYELTYGDVPAGLIVRHRCDNGVCVNPGHLMLGTHRDNAHDRDTRTGKYEGVTHHFAHLTPNDVEALLAMYRAGARASVLAKRYGMSRQAVGLILSGKNWKSVTKGIDIRRSTKV